MRVIYYVDIVYALGFSQKQNGPNFNNAIGVERNANIYLHLNLTLAFIKTLIHTGLVFLTHT